MDPMTAGVQSWRAGTRPASRRRRPVWLSMVGDFRARPGAWRTNAATRRASGCLVADSALGATSAASPWTLRLPWPSFDRHRGRGRHPPKRLRLDRELQHPRRRPGPERSGVGSRPQSHPARHPCSSRTGRVTARPRRSTSASPRPRTASPWRHDAGPNP
jgi:hypothetical protein